MNRSAAITGAAGIASVVAGVYLVSLPAAAIVLGLLLCAIGYLLLDDGRST